MAHYLHAKQAPFTKILDPSLPSIALLIHSCIHHQGEAYTDMIKLRRQQRAKESKKNIGGAYVPSSYPKKPSGLGNHYGTLGGPTTSFSAAQRKMPKYVAPGKNVLTNPAKQGTGYG